MHFKGLGNMTLDFNDWTAYDNWLVENYEEFDITKVNENEQTSKIEIEYEKKST